MCKLGVSAENLGKCADMSADICAETMIRSLERPARETRRFSLARLREYNSAQMRGTEW
jgi:hypothetical protein